MNQSHGNGGAGFSVFLFSPYGVDICGLLMYAVFRFVGVIFWSMPARFGSLPCDIVFFASGVWANRNGWLLPSIHSNLDLPVWVLRLSAVVEAAAMIGTALFAVPNNENWSVLVTVVAGVFCFIGWLIVLTVSNLICWPLGWWIRRLPGFNQVL